MGTETAELTPLIQRKLRKWDEVGIPRREMSRRTGISLYRVIKFLGRKPRKEREPVRPDHHIYAHHKPFREAARIAENFGYRLTAGDNAGKGSVGALIEGIGNGEVVVMRREEYDHLSRPFSVDEVPGRLVN